MLECDNQTYVCLSCWNMQLRMVALDTGTHKLTKYESKHSIFTHEFFKIYPILGNPVLQVISRDS